MCFDLRRSIVIDVNNAIRREPRSATREPLKYQPSCMNEPQSRASLSLDELPDDESLLRFSQILTHRLGGLVAGIEGYALLLSETLSTKEQRDLLRSILDGAARMETVLTDLYLYSQSRRPSAAPLRVCDLTNDVVAALEDAEERKVRIETEPAAADRLLRADPFLLGQAILALVRNALEAAGPGREILVKSRLEGDHVCFDVRNEGTIDVERPETTIFVPFYTTKAQNLGVGLSIAHRIAESHGGSLKLTANSPEEGTRFTLSIPVDA